MKKQKTLATPKGSGPIRDLLGVIVAFVALFVLLSIIAPTFFGDNLLNVARQITVNIILACALTMAILVGGIDLSVGSTIAVSSCLLGGLITNNGMALVPAIAISIAVGGVIGVFNGLIISFTNIPPFIVTLGTMYISRGVARLYTDTKTILITNETFSAIGRGRLFGVVPIQVIYIIFFCLLAWFILNRTKFGRHIYAVGDNEQAALYTGINVRRVKFMVYVLVGLFAACAGVLSAARTSSALYTAGEGYEMDAIAAVVLGGTSMTGGVGRIAGSIIGALIIGILGNGMNLLGFNASWQYVVKGAVLLFAVLLDYFKKKREMAL